MGGFDLVHVLTTPSTTKNTVLYYTAICTDLALQIIVAVQCVTVLYSVSSC